jgi:hypothetical protein
MSRRRPKRPRAAGSTVPAAPASAARLCNTISGFEGARAPDPLRGRRTAEPGGPAAWVHGRAGLRRPFAAAASAGPSARPASPDCSDCSDCGATSCSTETSPSTATSGPTRGRARQGRTGASAPSADSGWDPVGRGGGGAAGRPLAGPDDRAQGRVGASERGPRGVDGLDRPSPSGSSDPSPLGSLAVRSSLDGELPARRAATWASMRARSSASSVTPVR